MSKSTSPFKTHQAVLLKPHMSSRGVFTFVMQLLLLHHHRGDLFRRKTLGGRILERDALPSRLFPLARTASSHKVYIKITRATAYQT